MSYTVITKASPLMMCHQCGGTFAWCEKCHEPTRPTNVACVFTCAPPGQRHVDPEKHYHPRCAPREKP